MRIEEKLDSIIDEVILDIENNIDDYSNAPGKYFIRNRKITVSTLMKTLIVMEGNSLKKEIYDIYCGTNNMFTVSALIQQRAKLKAEAFKEAFTRFNDKTRDMDLKKLCGMRLLAVDGSDLNITLNPDSDSYFGPDCSYNPRGYNQLHINALYDIQNNVYEDVVIEPSPKKNEIKAAKGMVQNLKTDSPALITADRGYVSLDFMETIKLTGNHFLIRCQSGQLKEFQNFPADEPFDIIIDTTILTQSNKRTKELLKDPKYRFLSGPSSKGKTKKTVTWFLGDNYHMQFRAVRFQLSTGEYETILTSLSKEFFPPEKIKELYHLRWGIETSFRTLKYAIGLNALHSKKEEFIKQEIYARLLMFNFCSRIVNTVVIEDKAENAHEYKVNFTQAIHICFNYMKRGTSEPIVSSIRKFIEPVRPGRQDKRKVKPKQASFFIYRVA